MSLLYTDNMDMVQDHVQDITERELDMLILKIGSLLCILNNKKTNQVKLLISLVLDEQFKKCALLITEIDSFEFLVRYLMDKYPTLCKSKIISGALKRGKRNRKKYI